MSEARSEPVVKAESGSRARTRRAILDAAVRELSANAAVPLGEIATAAGVGRTTLHRYFPERADLLVAVTAFMEEQIASATGRARLDDGSARAALGRLCQEYFELGDVLTLMFTSPVSPSGREWDYEMPSDHRVRDAVDRGHAEGDIDAALSREWVLNMVWSLLFTTWDMVSTQGAPKHEALTQCLRTLDKALTP
ncbi:MULTISPECIES: TetR/AcrR family transcriptional regulator [Actinosynnema]|uniref:TetR/AcrR family transcriptional regulator n=1 Tax=Actinosynnema TaxID=40566 RepID=UPI0020A37390|nr:TetR/AcrR family transcriptional regulator [Actinosynnema pretiosum]MCP2092181.1 transcriptional regulator, TetR family [Actinosynnema pretiosum]